MGKCKVAPEPKSFVLGLYYTWFKSISAKKVERDGLGIFAA